MRKWILFLSLFIQASLASAQVKDWTVLVYWAVDNDLYEFSKPYLHQFEKVGSNSNLNIVVQYDLPKSPTQRYFINKKTRERLPDEDLVSSTLVETFSRKSNSSDPITLSAFIKWGKEKYPAKKYLFIIASHGSNWSGIIHDETARGYMSLKSLQKALNDQKLDLLLFDACRISFIETVVGLNGTAPLMVGSPFDVDGFNHVTPLATISGTAEVTPEKLASLYVKSYPAVESVSTTGVAASALYLKTDLAFIKDFNEFVGMINGLKKSEQKSLLGSLSTTGSEGEDLAIDLFELIDKASQISIDLKLLGADLLARKNQWIHSSSVSTDGNSPSGLSITCADNLR